MTPTKTVRVFRKSRKRTEVLNITLGIDMLAELHKRAGERQITMGDVLGLAHEHRIKRQAEKGEPCS